MTDFTTWRSLIDGEEMIAIPDSEANQKLLHRWVLNDVNGTVEDSEGDADGTNNGIQSTGGDWILDAAGEGDGDSHIATTTLGDFGSSMDSDFAIALSFTTADNDGNALGVWETAGFSGMALGIPFDGVGGVGDGNFAFLLQDNNDNTLSVNTQDETFDDGAEYRVVLNKTGNSASDLEIWANQTEESTNTESDDNFGDVVNFTEDLYLFARNAGGSAQREFDGVIDDICIFNDSLTQSEIESYNNPWS